MLKQSDVAQAIQASGVQVFNLAVKDIGGMTAVFGNVANAADKQRVQQAIEAKLGKISNHLEVNADAAPAAPSTTTWPTMPSTVFVALKSWNRSLPALPLRVTVPVLPLVL